MDKLLSICIPTYNRVHELIEIIDGLLTIDSEDFEVVVTDNLSTDETEQRIRAYTDRRVRYCRNEEPIKPFLNMIHSIWNAKGKYALYCNDRDILIPHRLAGLLNFLKDSDYAFLWAPAISSKRNIATQIFNSEFDSIMNHACIHHPTGMVFNRMIIENHLDESEYAKYEKYINTYDFLMMDLFQYGKTVIYSEGYWTARPTTYIKKNKSGTRIYFSPDIRECMFYGVIDHLSIIPCKKF